MSRRRNLPAGRPPEQRHVDNQLYGLRVRQAGLVQLSVVIPVEKVPVLKALAAEWRAEARALLESDLPTADQILQIHSIARTLGIPLPVDAFRTRGAAASWLLAQEPELGGDKPLWPEVMRK